MKNLISRTLVLGIVVLAILSCAPKDKAAAGSASPDDILSYLPVDAQGMFFIDFHRAITTPFADKMIKDDENYQKYLEFVEKTGIDPQEDVYYIAVGLMSQAGPEDMGAAAVINLKYDKDVLLDFVQKQEKGELITEDYKGVTLYSWEDENLEDAEDDDGEGDEVIAFLDESNVVAGDIDSVTACIDVHQKTRENVFKNVELAQILDRTDKSTMLWGAILIAPETISEAVEGNPRLEMLKSLTALTMNFDHRNRAVFAEINAESHDATKNKQIVDMLNGFKAMGAMLAAQKPEVGQLLDSISITSTEESIKIVANIPEELIQQMKDELPEDIIQ